MMEGEAFGGQGSSPSMRRAQPDEKMTAAPWVGDCGVITRAPLLSAVGGSLHWNVPPSKS